MNSAKNSSGRPKRRPIGYYFLFDFVKITGAIPTLIWMRPKVYRPYGTKVPKGGVLISANHRSLVDPVIIYATFPFKRISCLATKDLYKNKLLTFFFNHVHCIQVDKANFAISSFRDVVTRLSLEELVAIFPEGGLNPDKEDHLQAFKSGAILMAHRAGAQILPIYIVKREKWYHRQRVVMGRPYDVCANIGKIPTMAEINRASEDLRNMELELREYFESLPIYKKLNKNSKHTESQNGGNKKDEQTV